MLASLLSSVVSGEAIASARRAKSALVAYAVAGIIGLVGVIFLLVAVYVWLSTLYGALYAAGSLGVGFLLLSGLILLFHKFAAGTRAKREAKRRRNDFATVAAASAVAAIPVLASRMSITGLILTPLIAAVGYQILRENSRSPERDEEDED